MEMWLHTAASIAVLAAGVKVLQSFMDLSSFGTNSVHFTQQCLSFLVGLRAALARLIAELFVAFTDKAVILGLSSLNQTVLSRLGSRSAGKSRATKLEGQENGKELKTIVTI